MTGTPFLLTQVVYFALSFICLVDLIASRNRPRLLAALTFGAFAGFILTQDLLALGYNTAWINHINRTLLLVHPFLLLHLVHLVQPVRARVRRAAQVFLVLLGVADLLLFNINSGLAGLLILSYFMIFEAYAALAAASGAGRTTGVPRRRLQLVAAGSGALALVLVYLLLSLILPVLRPAADWVIPLLTSLSAICHYLGFATPRWLRQTFQLNELYHFLRTVGGHPPAERAALAVDELCQAGARVAGGIAAATALVAEPAGGLVLRSTADHPQLAGPLLPESGAVGRAWSTGQPATAHLAADFGLAPEQLAGLGAADVMLAVPIGSGQKRWGLLLVFRRARPPSCRTT